MDYKSVNQSPQSVLQMATPMEAEKYSIDGMSASFIARPTNITDVRESLKFASQDNLAIAPWGGGTRMTLGNVPRKLDLILETTRLDKIIDLPPGDLTATVQAGITISTLQESLGKHGQFLAIDPPLANRATLGGTLAVGTSGPFKWQYGSLRDTVIGMKIINASGILTKSGGQVVKNVSGYDMSRLHIGGLGTLGIIAEASLKLTPLPMREATLISDFTSLSSCFNTALEIFKSSLMPLAITVTNSEANSKMRSIESLGPWTLLVRLGGRPLTLQRTLSDIRNMIHNNDFSQETIIDSDSSTSVWKSLSDFGWDKRTQPTLGIRVNVLPSTIPSLIKSFLRLYGKNRMPPAIVAHPAHGTILVSWFTNDHGETDDTIDNLIEKAKTLASQSGGNIVVENVPISTKSRIDVWGNIDRPQSVVQGLKTQYDPNGLLNPGRFVSDS